MDLTVYPHGTYGYAQLYYRKNPTLAAVERDRKRRLASVTAELIRRHRAEFYEIMRATP